MNIQYIYFIFVFSDMSLRSRKLLYVRVDVKALYVGPCWAHSFVGPCWAHSFVGPCWANSFVDLGFLVILIKN